MKKLDITARRTLVFALLLTVSNLVFSQTLINRPNTYVNENCNGYVEFLPGSYNNNTDKYPLLIYFHGNSQFGPGTDSSLQLVRDLGPNFWINVWLDPANSWLPFPGIEHLSKMVMISPQFIGPDIYTNPPTIDQMNSVIDYACTHYRIDRSRVYVSGTSLGGAFVMDYAAIHPYRVAAIVPFATAAGPYQPWADSMASSNLPIWMFHNLYDNVVSSWSTTNWIPMLNNPTAPIPPPNPLAYATFPPIVGHWYDDTYRGVDTATNGLNMNMYKWMLQYSRPDYFLGGYGSSWENPANWSYNAVPDESTEAVLNYGPVVINSNAACKKITVRQGVSLTVNSGFSLKVKK